MATFFSRTFSQPKVVRFSRPKYNLLYKSCPAGRRKIEIDISPQLSLQPIHLRNGPPEVGTPLAMSQGGHDLRPKTAAGTLLTTVRSSVGRPVALGKVDTLNLDDFVLFGHF